MATAKKKKTIYVAKKAMTMYFPKAGKLVLFTQEKNGLIPRALTEKEVKLIDEKHLSQYFEKKEVEIAEQEK